MGTNHLIGEEPVLPCCISDRKTIKTLLLHYNVTLKGTDNYCFDLGIDRRSPPVRHASSDSTGRGSR